MVLESTMICLDNSDWMRNGDYVPSRLEAQKDAAGLICNDRTGSNPENTVGILAMAGNGVDLLLSPTEEAGKILASFAGISIGGFSDISTSVQIAQLALKHRKNKNGGQRIILFIGAPIMETVEQLQKIGKQLKKNNVSLDIISMGEIEDNGEKLLEFINAANSNENCHLITVPPGVSPANAVVSSPVMSSGGGMMMDGGMSGGASSGGDNFDMYGGIDPSMDPELAMAIRVSTEEARAQEEARMKAMQEDGGSSTAAPAAPASSSGTGNEDDDALMQRALEMSMSEMMTAAADPTSSGDAAPMDMEDEMDEDEELQRALALSMGTGEAETPAGSSEGFVDPAFVSQLLGAVDQSDPLIQAALAQLQQDSGDSKNNEEKKDEKNDKGE